MFPAIDRRPAPRSSIAGNPVAGGLVARGPVAGGPIPACVSQAVAAGPDRPNDAVFLEGLVHPPARPRRLARARKVLFALCGAATILIGCPLYSDSCDSRNDCASGFYCDEFSRE